MKKVHFLASVLVLFTLTPWLLNGQSKETRNVCGFTKVSFGVSGDLFIKIGPEFKLVIEGDKDILEDIETVVSGDRLNIKKDNWNLNFDNERVTINLTMPELEGLGVSGSGKVQIMDPVEADDLSLSVSGSGKLITSDLNVDNFSSAISGSGDIILGSGGSIDRGEISISGSGGFSGEGIEIDNLEVSISGSGDCRCRAGDSLEARVSGSGNITYIGNPKVDARVSGSGHVRSK
jgi:Putative auto-transporter adhesin, head GIN domain